LGKLHTVHQGDLDLGGEDGKNGEILVEGGTNPVIEGDFREIERTKNS